MAGNELNFHPTPQLLVQFCTMHKGVVKKVGDKHGRLRVRAECPVLLGTGKDNWTQWLEVFSGPIGDNVAGGDQGDYKPLQPGQQVLVGFASGDPVALFCIPGPPVQESPEPGTQMVPLEAKAVHKKKGPRAATRLRIWKSEAGHTLLMDDNGKSEYLFVRDWTGAGDAYYSPGKIEDEREQEDDESKPRKGKRRGVKSALTAKRKPSEIIEGGVQIIGRYDMNGSGVYTIATDNAGLLVLVASSEVGKIDNYVILNNEAKLSIMGAGKTQIWCDDNEGHIYTTSSIIQNQPSIDVQQALDVIQKKLAERDKEYEDDGRSGDSSSGGGSQSTPQSVKPGGVTGGQG